MSSQGVNGLRARMDAYQAGPGLELGKGQWGMGGEGALTGEHPQAKLYFSILSQGTCACWTGTECYVVFRFSHTVVQGSTRQKKL